MSAVRDLEDRLAAATGRRHAIATGRGAAAISIALDALAERYPERSRVILPATLCLSPPAVTRLAGLEPVFCDVEPHTGQMDPAALETLLREGPVPLCVIAAHLYGEPCRIGDIAALCRSAGTVLMEDAAQAWGARIDGRPAGAFGELSVVSFGHTKILDAGGGGAVLTDDKALADRLRVLADDLPPKPEETAAWGAQYRERYYALAREFETRPSAKRDAGELCLARPGLYRYRLDAAQANRILGLLPASPDAVAHRRAMARTYDETLDPGLSRLARRSTGVPWRFSVLLEPAERDSLVGALRGAGLDASTWYPCAAPFFTDARREDFPGAAQLDASILNLWTDESVSEEKARRTSTFINEALAQLRSSRRRKVAP